MHFCCFGFAFGVAELALGVAYRHIWRQDGRYGEGTISSALSLQHEERFSSFAICLRGVTSCAWRCSQAEEHWRVDGTFYPSKHPIMLLWCLRVFHCIERILSRSSELRYRVSQGLRCLPWHDICKKRRPNVAPVVGGSETHAGGDRQYGASIVRIVVRSLALQNGGSKIRCILSLCAHAFAVCYPDIWRLGRRQRQASPAFVVGN